MARLPLLESLDLSSDAVKDVHIRALADGKCPPHALTALRLNSRRLTSACFHALAGLPLLRSLEIGGHVRKVYAQTLEPLYDLKKLKHLEVSRTPFSQSAFCSLSARRNIVGLLCLPAIVVSESLALALHVLRSSSRSKMRLSTCGARWVSRSPISGTVLRSREPQRAGN